jgi:hypothetical protein
MHSSKGLLAEDVVAYATTITAKLPYDVTVRADYQGKYIKLRLYHISSERKFWNEPRLSGITLLVNPNLLAEYNEKAIHMAIDALVSDIERKDHE